MKSNMKKIDGGGDLAVTPTQQEEAKCRSQHKAFTPVVISEVTSCEECLKLLSLPVGVKPEIKKLSSRCSQIGLESETLIFMSDGKSKKIKDVTIGDYVMGVDYSPKLVVAKEYGRAQLCKIIPNKGDPWECTYNNSLVLKCNFSGRYKGLNKGDCVSVKVGEYKGWSNGKKHIFKQLQTSLDFPEQEVSWDPYVIGAFLGDGSSGRATITLGKKKDAIAEYIHNWSKSQGFIVTLPPSQQKESCQQLSIIVPKDHRRMCGEDSFTTYWKNTASCNRAIPEEYLRNSRRVRLEMLAGLLDTDGSLNNKKSLEFSTRYKELCDSFLYLCRSLGFRTTYSIKYVQLKGWDKARGYYRFTISGNIDEIPFKTPRFYDNIRLSAKEKRPNPLTTGFTVEDETVGNYTSIQLEGDEQKIIMDNFTVTGANPYLVSSEGIMEDVSLMAA